MMGKNAFVIKVSTVPNKGNVNKLSNVPLIVSSSTVIAFAILDTISRMEIVLKHALILAMIMGLDSVSVFKTIIKRQLEYVFLVNPVLHTVPEMRLENVSATQDTLILEVFVLDVVRARSGHRGMEGASCLVE